MPRRTSVETPLVGAHVSIAGGLHLAVERGAAAGCAAVQIFTKNSTQWRERVAGPGEVALFRAARERHPEVRVVFSHAGYLLNLAARDAVLRRRSVTALVREVERCDALGLPLVVIHPGSHGGDGEEVGLARAASSLRKVVGATPGSGVRVLLEVTAGQGNSLGHRFEHLAFLLREGGPPERLGVCFDTCHAFAAGYDLRTPSAWRRTMDELDREVGLERVLVVHANDAKKGLGSRVDRHEHVGRGAIGLGGFRLLMRDSRLRAIPKVLETPKLEEGVDMDSVNLGILRKLWGRGK